MARLSYDFNFNNNFNIQKGAPLDSRIVVEYLSDLISDNEYNEDGSIKTLSAWSNNEGKKYLYNGLVVSVLEDNSLYMLVDYKKQSNTDFSGWLRLDKNVYDVNIIKNPTFSTDSNDNSNILNWNKTINTNGGVSSVNGILSISAAPLTQKIKINEGDYNLRIRYSNGLNAVPLRVFIGTGRTNIKINGEIATSSTHQNGYVTLPYSVNTFNDCFIRFSSTGTSFLDFEITQDRGVKSNIKEIELREVSPYKLESGITIKTINGQSILGDGNISIDANSLGVGTALYFLGVTTTNLSDGVGGSTVVIDGTNKTAETGAVVFSANNNKEYVYNGSTWRELGFSTDISSKQDKLISGSNIKTINGQSLLGNGNFEIVTDVVNDLTSGGTDKALSAEQGKVLRESIEENELTWAIALNTLSSDKQDKLISGSNIKTINGQSLLGNGNFEIKSTYDSTLKTSSEVPYTVGGIQEGNTLSNYKGDSFIELFDKLLFPTDYPVPTEPKITGFKFTNTDESDNIVVRIGTDTHIKFESCAVDRGRWNKYNDEAPYAGPVELTTYEFYVNKTNYNTIDTPTTFTNPGNHTYTVTISLGTGVSPYDNKGNACDDLKYLSANKEPITETKTINATYPYYILFTDTPSVEILERCDENSDGTFTINMSSIDYSHKMYIPSVKVGDSHQLFKVYGDLEINVVDPFGEIDENGIGYSKLDLESIDEEHNGTKTGYKIYSYPNMSSRGRVRIHSGKITFR